MPVLDYWHVPRSFPGATVFIVGGGPSAARHNLARLIGRPVIAINTSYQAAPFADFMLFNDPLFWVQHRDRAQAQFAGQILCTNDADRGHLKRLKRRRPIGLTQTDFELGVEFTTMTAAFDLAYLLGASRIVTLGLDGRPDELGRTHHHEPHAHCSFQDWDAQRRDLETYVEPLRAAGIDVVNASPGSAVPFWPIVDLFEECLS